MQMLFINFSAAGIPIRTTMDNSTTVQYAGLFHQLTSKARNTVRDIDPQVWNVFVLFSKCFQRELIFRCQHGGRVCQALFKSLCQLWVANSFCLRSCWSTSLVVLMMLVKFRHSPILHYAFSSWIEKAMTKTIHCHWENRFVLQWHGALRKFYHDAVYVIFQQSLYLFWNWLNWERFGIIFIIRTK